ncbi:MAG TPA: YdeI/OmpD-associated family protein [Chitinivibrionales bacterium]|nr:YdeI/OmpD-associated family protein [Chitinivibrionales bacterium]
MKTLQVTNRKQWRSWLKKHYKSEKEVWLVYYKKETGKPRISYNDAVEEALCFGWIDSIVRRIDDRRFAQRFTPRNPKTPYSQSNRERLAALAKKGKVMHEVLTAAKDVFNGKFEIPRDIMKSIKADKAAWRNFQEFSQSYIKIRIAFIDGARNRPAEFRKRLKYFIAMTKKKRTFGFGGIEKYY